MKNGVKNNLEFKYLVFVASLLVIVFLWEVISGGGGRGAASALFDASVPLAGIALVSFIFWLVLKKSVIRPLQSLEKTASALAAGDLTSRAAVDADDAIGETGVSFNESLRSLAAIFSRMKNGSKRMRDVADQVETELKHISESTRLESESIADIAASLEEMNFAAAEISASAEQLAASTEEKAASMHEMAASIGQVAGGAGELAGVIDSTAASISELSQTIKEVAGKAEELAAASEDTLAAAEEISASIKEVEQSARDSASLSEKVKDDAVRLGIASVEKTLEGIKEIKSSFEKTDHFIKKLGIRSEEIGKILNVIDEITDQTTLLALNAAILAAQAGEHGKGFSVVAEEIKDLAERTSFSTHEISELIQAVREEVREAASAMEEGLGSVEAGLAVAKDAGDALEKVVASSKRSAEMSHSIERSTAEQAKSTRLVSESMERVKHMASHVVRTTQEQSRGAVLISKATEKMRNVAAQVSNATSEQMTNSRQVSEAMELVSEKSVQIASAVAEQRAGARRIFDLIEKIKDLPKTSAERVFSINRSLQGLFGNSELLMQELKKIRLPDEQSVNSSVLRFGIEPSGMALAEVSERFAPLTRYLSEKLSSKIEVRTLSDSEGVLRDLAQGLIHFCYLSPITYLMAHERYGTEVLVKVVAEGRGASRAAIITKRGSDIKAMKNIAGRTFAFGNSHSMTGYLGPRIALLDEGIDLHDLLHYEYIDGERDVIEAVAAGRIDAGGVDEATALSSQDKGIEIISLSEEMPPRVICASRELPGSVKSSLINALTSVSQLSSSAAILDKIRCSGFERAVPEEFSRLKKAMEKLGINGGKTLR
jgi:phosphate/phosphite/phosphonate ABC transporter binding protein